MLDPLTIKKRASMLVRSSFSSEIYSLWRLRDRDTIEAYLVRDAAMFPASDVDLGRLDFFLDASPMYHDVLMVPNVAKLCNILRYQLQ